MVLAVFRTVLDTVWMTWYATDPLAYVTKAVNRDILGNSVRKVNMFNSILYYNLRTNSTYVKIRNLPKY